MIASALIGLLVVLGACSLRPIDFDQNPDLDIRTIGLVPIGTPKVYDYRYRWHTPGTTAVAAVEPLSALVLLAVEVTAFLIESVIKIAQAGLDNVVRALARDIASSLQPDWGAHEE